MVIDANVLVRAVFGKRVRQVIVCDLPRLKPIEASWEFVIAEVDHIQVSDIGWNYGSCADSACDRGIAEDQQAELALWLTERERTRWDEEIEHDFSAQGAGAELLEQIKNRVKSGRSRPFSEGAKRA